MAMKPTDYDERIKRAEAQLKKWKADKKRLSTKETKAAQREAEAKRDEELRQEGYQFENLENWMKSRTIDAEGAQAFSVGMVSAKETRHRQRFVIVANMRSR